MVFDANPADFNVGKGRVTPQGDITVPIGTIDDRLGGLTQPVSVVKIDTEGHELEVLKGAGDLLNKHRPAMLMELNPEFYSLAESDSTCRIDTPGFDCRTAPGMRSRRSGPNRVTDASCWPPRMR